MKHEDLTIWVNKNVKMSSGKLAAQAVHAALMYYGIPHGAVRVLRASRRKVEGCGIVVRDAGLTEIKPGTVTTGI